MYGLPKDFTGQVFVGRMLRHVAVFSNQMIFDFDGECWLRLESSYTYSKAGTELGSNLFEVPQFAPELMRILDQRVSLASAEPDGTLELTFENGDRLTFHDPDRRYEAYHLGWHGGELTV